MNNGKYFLPPPTSQARSRPPILWGQLIETKEQKDRFFEGQNGSVFLGRQKNIKTGFKVGCCFNEGLIRVLQTLDLVGVVCHAGGIASLYPRLFFRFASRASHDSMSRYLPPSTSQARSRPPILWGQLIETKEQKDRFFEGQNGSGFLGRQKNKRTGS